MAKYLGNIAHRHDGVNKEYADGVVKDAFWAPVHAVSSVDQVLSGVGSLPVIDGIQTVAGYRVLLNGQTDATKNGIYVVTGDATAWQLERASDAATADRYRSGKPLCVLNGGALYGNAIMSQSSANMPEGTVLDTAGAVIKFTANASAKDATGVPASATPFTANGTDNDYDITHTFGTTNLIAQVYEVATGLITQADVSPIDNTTVRVSIYPTPANGEVFKLVLVAAQAQLPIAGQSVYDATCTKNGTEYVVGVSGLPSPAPAYYTIRIVAPAAIESGDTWTINGDTYTAIALSGGAIPAGFFAKDAVVTMEVDSANKKCFFRSGGGAVGIGDGTLNVFWGATPPDDVTDGLFIQLSEEPADLVVDTHPVLTGLTGGSWHLLEDPPAFAYGASYGGQGIYCYIVGGYYREPEYSNAVFRYNTQTKVFERLADLPTTVQSGKVFIIGDKLYLVAATNDPMAIRILNLTNNTWSTGTPRSTVVRYCGVTAVGTKLYFIGGTKEPLDAGWQYMREVEIYDTATDSWSAGPSMPEGRAYCGSAYLDGYIYVLSGVMQAVANGNQEWNTTTCLRLEVSSSAWSRINSMLTGRTYLTTAVRGGKIYTASSASAGQYLGEVYDPLTNKWGVYAPADEMISGGIIGLDDALYVDVTYKAPSESLLVTASEERLGLPLPQSRSNAGSRMVNGKLAIIGGYPVNGAGQNLNDGMLIDPVTGDFEMIPAIPANLSNYIGSNPSAYMAALTNKIFINYQVYDNSLSKYVYMAYNLSTKAWETLFDQDNTVFPMANMNQKTAGYGDKIIMASNGTYWSQQSKTLYAGIYNPADGTFVEIPKWPSDLDAVSMQQSTAWFTIGNILYVLPGTLDGTQSLPPNAVYYVDLSAGTMVWNSVAIPAEMQPNLFFRWDSFNYAVAGTKVYIYRWYDRANQYMAVPSMDIIVFDSTTKTFTKFKTLSNPRPGGFIGATPDSVILAFGNDIFVGEDKKYVFGSDTSVFQDGTIILRTGSGKRIKLFDDGTKRVFTGINGVYKTNGTVDEPINAQYNVNGEGWKNL